MYITRAPGARGLCDMVHLVCLQDGVLAVELAVQHAGPRIQYLHQ
jgi:hypothetical protein